MSIADLQVSKCGEITLLMLEEMIRKTKAQGFAASSVARSLEIVLEMRQKSLDIPQQGPL